MLTHNTGGAHTAQKNIFQKSRTAASKTISAKTHHQNVDFNIFEGMTVTGCASHTISQGKVLYANGELQVTRGAGRYIKRPPYAPYYDAIQKQVELAKPQRVER